MGFWSKLKDIIFGYDVVSVDDAVKVCTSAIKSCDVDSNGMLNLGEVISTVKASLKMLKE